MDSNEEFKQRQIAFYSAMLNAWLTTKLELDKHLLSLATFALGLIVTLATTVGFHNPYAQILVFLSALAFCVTIFSILRIFEVNAEIVVSVIRDDDGRSEETKKRLRHLDVVASYTFKTGVILLFATAIIITSVRSVHKESQLDTKNSQQKSQNPEKQQVKNSWDTVNELKPVKQQQPINDGASEKKKE